MRHTNNERLIVLNFTIKWGTNLKGKILFLETFFKTIEIQKTAHVRRKCRPTDWCIPAAWKTISATNVFRTLQLSIATPNFILVTLRDLCFRPTESGNHRQCTWFNYLFMKARGENLPCPLRTPRFRSFYF